MIQTNKHLSIYLNDHLAGATSGIELVRRAQKSNAGSPLGDYLATLASEIAEDRAQLKAIMQRLGIRPNPAKVAGGWATEKLGRLKLNGQLRGYSPLSRVIELEGLVMGITGKLEAWRALRALAATDPRLDATLLDQLTKRAERQRSETEDQRLAAATAAFGS